jgi:hypothetical protein
VRDGTLEVNYKLSGSRTTFSLSRRLLNPINDGNWYDADVTFDLAGGSSVVKLTVRDLNGTILQEKSEAMQTTPVTDLNALVTQGAGIIVGQAADYKEQVCILSRK